MSNERTTFIALSDIPGATEGERAHCVELLSGPNRGRRYEVTAEGLTVGRIPPADIVLGEADVSRQHCRLTLEHGKVIATDLGSTNGTYLDGVRLTAPAVVPVGAVLRIGTRQLKHELLTGEQLRQSEEQDRDIATAASYVQALLPAKLTSGPVLTDWMYLPSAKLGGDAFGYMFLDERHFVFGLIDVSGHGSAAALHSVAVLNVLRQQALPNTDMKDPGAVLTTLNQMFQMDTHADMYFTMWYGVYDIVTRKLDFAAAGHHAAIMLTPERDAAHPLGLRAPMIGGIPGRSYRSDSTVIPPDACIYLFSDGVFEIVTNSGQEWRLDDFVSLLLADREGPEGECDRLLRKVQATVRGGELDDDFSLVTVRLP